MDVLDLPPHSFNLYREAQKMHKRMRCVQIFAEQEAFTLDFLEDI